MKQSTILKILIKGIKRFGGNKIVQLPPEKVHAVSDEEEFVDEEDLRFDNNQVFFFFFFISIFILLTRRKATEALYIG